MAKSQDEIKSYKKVMRPLKWLWLLIMVILILFFSVYFLLKLPAVQNYVADQVVRVISDKLNTKVTLDEVDINIFKGIHLENFYVEDRQGNELAKIRHLHLDLLNSLSSFYNKSFRIGSLQLEDGEIHLVRGKNTARNNLMELFYNADRDTLAKDSTKVSIYDLQLQHIVLRNIKFSNMDSIYSQEMTAGFKYLESSFDTFDIRNNKFHFDYLNLSEPNLYVHKFKSGSIDTTVVESNLPAELIASEDGSQTLLIGTHSLSIEDGWFGFLDENRDTIQSRLSSFDPAKFAIESIQADLKQVHFRTPYYGDAIVENLSFKSEDFILESAQSSRLFVDETKAGLEELVFKTNNSTISDELIFKYRKIQDWQEFVDKVILDFNLQNSELALEDLLFWSPQLQENPFFKENYNKKILINADVSGRINLLNIKDIRLRIGSELLMTGSFIARNLTTPDDAIVNASIDNLSTNIRTLNKLIPGFTPPENFYKLKKIDFTGRFDGFFQDFVAYGDLTTSLGRADTDMRLNLKGGSGKASYSGNINLYDFDLQTWSGNADLGNLSISASITNGQGLELSTAYAELGGEIIAFDFKNYRYSGIVDGKLEQNLFDGKLSIEEENIDLDFSGNIDFQGKVPVYDFNADIRTLKLKKLNLSEDIDDMHGQLEIELTGNNVDSITGSAIGNQLQFIKNLDTLNLLNAAIASSVDKSGLRTIQFDSDIGNGKIVGKYKLTELPDAAIALLKTNYPRIFDKVNYIKAPPTSNSVAQFNIELIRPGPLFSFFVKDSIRMTNLSMIGNIDYEKNFFNIEVSVPKFQYNQFHFEPLVAILDSRDKVGDLTMTIGEGRINNFELNPILFHATSKSDTIYFELMTDKVLDSIENVNIVGDLVIQDKRFSVGFDQFEFDLLNDAWSLYPNNSFVLGDEYLDMENAIFEGGDKKIRFSIIAGNKGVTADIDDIDMFLFNQWIPNEKVKLGGNLTAQLSLDNIFTREGLNLSGGIANFSFNDILLGEAELIVGTELGQKKIDYDISITNTKSETIAIGQIDLANNTTNGKLSIEGLPLELLETFLEDGISNTQGSVTANMEYSGKLDDLNTSGSGEIINGATKINYLGVYYTFEDATFKIEKDFIDFSGAKLRDRRENLASIEGGLTHQNFRNLGVDCTIRSENFTLLNTTQETSPFYYGFGIGKADVEIAGLFTDIKINIEATTKAGTNMTLPITYFNKAREESFIPIVTKARFLADLKDELNNEEDGPTYVGMTLDMRLTVTPEAEMTVMFDPATGHLLRGTGSGDINLNLNPDGEISMVGGYDVEDGVYDFALQNFIKKRFFIQQGGTIRWDGPPVNATIDIAADYKTLKAPVNLFLAEYLSSNEQAQDQASVDTDVKLTVFLQDKLLNPTIKFDLEFPTLSGELKSYAENKMTILESDPVGLNNQVFGLLIFNNFLPYNNPIGGFNNSTITSSASVIMNEFLSAQMSAFASSLLESILNEKGFIYDVDIDLNVNNSIGQNDPTEYGLKLTPKFNTDKINISIGGDYYDPTNATESYLGGDVIFDYFINKDKTLKIRLYAVLDKDPIYNYDRRIKTGTGLYYRKDFEKLWDFSKLISKVADTIEQEEKKKEQSNQEQ